MTTPGTPHVLLIEDNPGDVRLIEEFLRDVPQTSNQENETSGVPSLQHADCLTAGLEQLEEHEFDVVLLDLGLPESKGLETLETVLQHIAHTPIVVLTGLKDESVGMQAVEQGAQEYLVKDEITSALLQRSLRYAIERQNRERRVTQQSEQLAALNHLNAIVRDINEALVQQSTRDEMEQLICDRLAASESYRFAWIGTLDRNSREVTVRAEAGVEGYLDEVTITADEGEAANGPTARTINSQEMQVVQRIPTDPEYEHWRDRALEHGFKSSAAIPIVHEDILYGVLNVYAARPDAFDGQERTVISQLGETIGHAIAALDRKAALMSDETTEIEFQVQGILKRMGVSEVPNGSITFDRTIPVDDGSHLAYGTVTEDAVAILEGLAEQVPHFEDVKIIDESFGTSQFELHLSKPPVISTLASQGGRIQKATIENGDYHLVVHVPPGADVRQLTEAMQDIYPDTEVIAQRQTTRREESTQQVQTAVTDDLTERQRTALETAYFAGFFNWPRDSSGEEVAESLGVSASTFHQHVRLGQSKLLEALFTKSAENG